MCIQGVVGPYCSEIYDSLRNVPDCCQMSPTSLKLGTISAGTVRHMSLWKYFHYKMTETYELVLVRPVNGIIHIHHKNVRSDKICHPQR